MTLQEALNSLPRIQRQEIQLAFDDMRSHVLYLDNNKFLAVHFDNRDHHEVLEQKGYWTYGQLTNGQQSSKELAPNPNNHV